MPLPEEMILRRRCQAMRYARMVRAFVSLQPTCVTKWRTPRRVDVDSPDVHRRDKLCPGSIQPGGQLFSLEINLNKLLTGPHQSIRSSLQLLQMKRIKLQCYP